MDLGPVVRFEPPSKLLPPGVRHLGSRAVQHHSWIVIGVQIRRPGQAFLGVKAWSGRVAYLIVPIL